VFNGYVEQYDHAPISVRADEQIRVWVVDAGPQLATSFHVVGTQFDTVFKEGAYLLRPGNAEHGAAQTLDLAPAQGGFVEFTPPRGRPLSLCRPCHGRHRAQRARPSSQ
jgi:nitrite reductase (NO-forming)